jgi:ABC-type sugar transport system ATPase subunit
MIIKNMIRDYDEFKVDILELKLADHGVTALIGPSGSGKSSVIRILLGLDSCPGLSWILNGEDIALLPIEKRRLAVVFQSYELFRHMTARENILFAATARGISNSLAIARLAELSAKLQISAILNRKTSVLSGGEKQRVALARALIGEPRFLFLDEPFSALDANLRSEARQLVKKIVQEYKIPTLLVSHDASDIEALADEVVYIADGKIVNKPAPGC